MTDESNAFDRLDEDVQRDDLDRSETYDEYGRPGAVNLQGAETSECAGCGCGWTHQFKVEVFFRDEDSRTGVHVTATRDGAEFDEDVSGCPSSRRSGLAVWFYCEQCYAVTCISYAQHKGETYVEREMVGGLEDRAGGMPL